MSRLLRTLVKVGLVELDANESEKLAAKAEPAPAPDDEVDRLLKDTEALLQTSGAAPPRAAPPPPPDVPKAAARAPAAKAPQKSASDAWSPKAEPSAASPLFEGRPLAEVYEASGVPACPFPAEKLLKLLDGLKAMEPAMRKAAVTAMDAADDAWSIEDPLKDAARKIQALQGARSQLSAVVTEAESRASADSQAADARQQEATQKIRAEIAELEALLQQELTEVANQRAAIQSRLQATREAAARESARLDQEITALNTILSAFSHGR